MQRLDLPCKTTSPCWCFVTLCALPEWEEETQRKKERQTDREWDSFWGDWVRRLRFQLLLGHSLLGDFDFRITDTEDKIVIVHECSRNGKCHTCLWKTLWKHFLMQAYIIPLDSRHSSPIGEREVRSTTHNANSGPRYTKWEMSFFFACSMWFPSLTWL